MKEKGKIVDSDEAQILKEQLRRHETSLQQQNADNQQIKKQLKEKSEQIEKLDKQVKLSQQEAQDKENRQREVLDKNAKEIKQLK